MNRGLLARTCTVVLMGAYLLLTGPKPAEARLLCSSMCGACPENIVEWCGFHVPDCVVSDPMCLSGGESGNICGAIGSSTIRCGDDPM
jgi:hypothetical protein